MINLSLSKIAKYSITLIAVVILSSYVELGVIINEYRNADQVLFLAAFLSIPLHVLLKSLKWQILLQVFWEDISFADATKSYLSGLAFGVITPGKIGELSRGLFLPFNKIKVSTLVIVDRYLDLISLVFLVIPGATYFFGIRVGVLFFFLNIVLLVIMFIYPRMVSLLSAYLKSSVIEKIIDIQRDITRIPLKVVVITFFLSFLVFILSIMTSYILVLSFTTFGIGNAFLAFPLTLITNILPITVGNIGVREGANIYLLNHFSISSEIAFNISVMMFSLHSLIPSIFGLILINYRGGDAE